MTIQTHTHTVPQGGKPSSTAAAPDTLPVRPERPDDDASVDNQSSGEPRRDLHPKSVQRQFGSSPDIHPVADQERGVQDWAEKSDGMRENFPKSK